ncbi:ABC transporter ATP-binding protein [Advenella sp. RU8]|jgi:peptide/nickel transport system ATP-binding protein|uniref:ABC transporter ATP-binding protein n=1 Tax=Advenella alkanexedens TaxID=1481665 RepID=A0ABS6NQI1_9BURK|nr:MULTISPECIES: ABC transporter ATP-binding protein [Advenella]MBV4397866.1 ABC transporter ATP-binding protein [Advenella alkanexedens]MDD3756879.1 ABC transporter ATP-binding protein [Advenella sp.]NLN66906.1 ABC transporter ATP-binding protein [Alcaligenaceae bacterium]
MSHQPLVKVQDLHVRFVSHETDVSVVNGVSFDLKAGEVLCLLGESGSGKSVTMRSLMRLLPRSAQLQGEVTIDGIDVVNLPDDQLHTIRGSVISMIFQEPLTAFDPVFTIGQQISEAIQINFGVDKVEARSRALELLELVQIPSAARRLDAYPHELSGGLRQRAMIALALSCRPKLLLADEPTTALDATVQIQVLLLLRELQQKMGMATIFVTHDLGVACEVADKIAVMYGGRFVETGSVEDVLLNPQHPYTKGLMRSTVHGGKRGELLKPIEGSPPDLSDLPPGCSFAPRCTQAQAACSARIPDMVQVGSQHFSRCIHSSQMLAEETV